MTNQEKAEYAFARRLSRISDQICNLILFSDLQWLDIQIEIEHMRDLIAQAMPQRLDLFEQLYESRFKRLWQQWRQ